MKTPIKTFSFKKGLPVDIEIIDLSVVKHSPHLFKGPFKATFYQIIRFTEGEAIFNIDFRPVRIRAGEVFLISVNQVYGFDIKKQLQWKDDLIYRWFL